MLGPQPQRSALDFRRASATSSSAAAQHIRSGSDVRRSARHRRASAPEIVDIHQYTGPVKIAALRGKAMRREQEAAKLQADSAKLKAEAYELEPKSIL